MKKKERLIPKIILGLFALIIILTILPYGISLSNADHYDPKTGVPDSATPYSNSAYYQDKNTFIHYRISEPAANGIAMEEGHTQNILLIHGFGGSSYSFEAAIPGLIEAGYRVMVVDLPGFGYSSRNTSENHAQAHRATLLWQLIDSTNISGSWHLVGHSMGAGAAAAMAIERPESTRTLTFIDGALFNASSSGPSLTTFPPILRWTQVALEYLFISPKNIEKTLISAYATAPTEEQIQGYYRPLALKGTAKSAPALLKTSKGLTSTQISSIQSPTLAIWGEKDTWVPLEQATQLKTLIKDFQLVVIEGAGHCPMETHTSQFVNAFLNYLNLFKH